MRGWTIKDSTDLYNIRNWGEGYFQINEQGHVEVNPSREQGHGVDLKLLVDDLVARGINLPILIRLPDVLQSRIQAISRAFNNAIQEYEYKGRYRGVYPIKVNQQRHIVEDLVHFATPHDIGLEAGSKPELLATLAMLDNRNALIVCNGYKDEEYMETAILARKLGRQTIIVIEKYSEFVRVARVAGRLGIEPVLGVRCRPSSRGAGRWEGSTGDGSKFGLSVEELVDGVEFLHQQGLLQSLKMLHFHIGSQVSAIRAFKSVLKEASRIYVELHRLGAPLEILDVGGGLGVDYDGSRTNYPSSVNYTVHEYAEDVVAAIQEACDAHGVPHPDIVTESGRAMVAHSSLLVFNVLGVTSPPGMDRPVEVTDDDEDYLWDLKEVHDSVSRKTFQEAYHDALQYREEALSRFELGLIDLRERARVERLFWQICQRILQVVRGLAYVPDELGSLEKNLADTYFCNFSVFQSAPDSWAVNQLFPIMPIHRLQERPTRRAILADITCDSDGKMDHFIDLRDVKDVLELHTPGSEPYYLCIFLVGAYQEILGDLHNLFGDTNAVHVSLDEDGAYRIDHVVEGDTVSEVLEYVQYNRHDLINRVRAACEQAMRSGDITIEESRRLLRSFTQGLDGYTYLE